jgi:hypothetical protein
VAGLPGWVRWLASSFLVLQRCTAKIRAPERGTSLRCFPAAISAMTGPTCIVDALGLAVRACSSVTFAAISLPCRDTRSLRSWRYAAPDAFRGFGDRRKRAPPRTLGPSWSPGMVLKWCDRNALSCACGNAGKICQCRRRVLCSSGHLTVHGPQTHEQPDSDATSLTAHRHKIIDPAHGAGHIAGWRLRWYASWLALIGQ